MTLRSIVIEKPGGERILVKTRASDLERGDTLHYLGEECRVVWIQGNHEAISEVLTQRNDW